MPGVLAACGGTSSGTTSSGGGGEKASVSLQLSFLENVQFGGSFVADARGYYTDEGLSVSLLPGGPNISTEPVVVAGKALIGITHTSECAEAIDNGAPLTVIGAGYQENPFCIISKETAPLTSPGAMRGKKIGVATANEPVFAAFLKANGIPLSAVRIVTIQFDPTPLATGEIDGLIGFYTNEAVQLELQGVPVHTMLLNDFGYPLLEELYIVRNDNLKAPSQRALIRKFMTAERRGWEDTLAAPAVAAGLAVSRYGVGQHLDLKQQTREAIAQNQLVAGPDTRTHGLFWMSPAKVAATTRSLALGSVKVNGGVFSNEILTEI
ncbi:MAG TPA: ABC transporter substrate-binding protein [Solirubrobacteraceae bacterium]|nr:ABC transporter substrate-binding protein [Solirubrobacteraceae bacterium]